MSRLERVTLGYVISPTQISMPHRRGTTVLEILAAGTILGVLLVVCAQMLSRTAVQQQAISNRRAATQMTANAMERISVLPWDALDQAALDAIASAVVGQGMLRGARLEIAVDEPDGTPRAKRIHVAAIWQESSDEAERRQILTAWRYREADPASRQTQRGGGQ